MQGLHILFVFCFSVIAVLKFVRTLPFGSVELFGPGQFFTTLSTLLKNMFSSRDG